MNKLRLKRTVTTIEQKIQTLNRQPVVVATTEFFCMLCENEITQGEEYLDSGRFCKAHKGCVDIAILQIEESGRFVGLEGTAI
jgi:hypothetical protein